MKGTMLVIPPDGPLMVTEFTAPIDVESLHKAVGGYVEVVPYFYSITHAGESHRCAVFCDEDGKRKKLTTNYRAIAAWEEALRRCSNFAGSKLKPDYLVGPIAVVYGDDEWMAEL